ncbi:hypothetical protein B0T09DRAFT_94785 [Sordaria sp. MPI-SDFR-AT-0083]|nr:hypothetical protein B0T09DRAFT_94785 [Sordaria sp. MPI-SDFR-AT-0083]
MLHDRYLMEMIAQFDRPCLRDSYCTGNGIIISSVSRNPDFLSAAALYFFFSFFAFHYLHYYLVPFPSLPFPSLSSYLSYSPRYMPTCPPALQPNTSIPSFPAGRPPPPPEHQNHETKLKKTELLSWEFRKRNMYNNDKWRRKECLTTFRPVKWRKRETFERKKERDKNQKEG